MCCLVWKSAFHCLFLWSGKGSKIPQNCFHVYQKEIIAHQKVVQGRTGFRFDHCDSAEGLWWKKFWNTFSVLCCLSSSLSDFFFHFKTFGQELDHIFWECTADTCLSLVFPLHLQLTMSARARDRWSLALNSNYHWLPKFIEKAAD